MDDRLHELVSRHLDGDLDEAETTEVSRLIEEDPAFAAEVETSRALQRTVGRIASQMEPPAALDAIMKPLRTSPRVSTRRVRPVFRWLGVAATVVLGATVALEMARRHPGPTPEAGGAAHSRPIQSEAEIFELAPLPTANPEEERPLGAADRLLAEEPPIPAPPEPQPLEVLGPLPGADPTREPEGAPSSTTAPPTGKGRAGEDSAVSSRDLTTGAPPSTRAAAIGTGDAAPAAVNDESRESSSSLKGVAQAAGAERSRPKRDQDAGRIGASPVVLVIDDSEVWWGMASSCADPATRVQVEVRDGVVVAVNPLREEDGAEEPSPCRPEGLVGATLADFGDGMHTAEIITVRR